MRLRLSDTVQSEKFHTMTGQVCNICESEDSESLGQIESKRYGPGIFFELYQCRNCELVYIAQPDTTTDFYPADYGPHDPERIESNSFRKKVTGSLRRFLFTAKHQRQPWGTKLSVDLLRSIYEKLAYRAIPTFRDDGKLLDIGCGVGSYLAIVKQLGWDAYGVEKNQRAAEYAQNVFGLNVTAGSFEEIRYGANGFDVVTMWHSLEHFKDPRSVLLKVRDLLKDNGTLMLGLPNYNSFDRKAFGESWNGLEIPLHLYHFTPRSIRRMLQHTGFDCWKITHTIRPTDMEKSTRNYLQDRFKRRNGYLSAVKLLFPAFVLLSSLTSFLGRSSVMNIYATKR